MLPTQGKGVAVAVEPDAVIEHEAEKTLLRSNGADGVAAVSVATHTAAAFTAGICSEGVFLQCWTGQYFPWNMGCGQTGISGSLRDSYGVGSNLILRGGRA